jgi:Uma2 family endonuclease
MSIAARRPPDSPIPTEAPTAPTEEAWTRMTPEQREQAVEALLASESQEEIEEREAMAEGDPHLDAKMSIRNSLRSHFGRLGRRIYVGADIKVYYPGKKGFTPDVIAVNDVDARQRDCWMVSKEGKGVDLAFEVHYKGDWRKDFVTNVKKYAALGIREYFIYDLRRELLKAYRLPKSGAAYEPIPPRGGRFRSRVLELDVALEAGEVRFYEGGAILVTETELVGKLEKMVDAAVSRAEEQAARAEQAAVRLASAIITILTVRGVDVDADARERILGSTELATLERWLERAATAAGCDELFGEG